MDRNNNQQKHKRQDSLVIANSTLSALQLSKAVMKKIACDPETADSLSCFIPDNDEKATRFVFKDRQGILRLEPVTRPKAATSFFDTLWGSKFEVLLIAPVKSLDEAYARHAHAYFWSSDVLRRRDTDKADARRMYILLVNKPRRLINPSRTTVRYLRAFFKAVGLGVETMTIMKSNRLGGNVVDYVSFSTYED